MLYRNAVLSYAVGTLNVKHVVVLGHYGCGGVMASMVPLPEGYEERYLTPSSTTSSPSPGSPSHPPADLAVQQWILPIRRIYETTVRWEIREHRERIQKALESGRISREEVAKILMADAAAASLSGSPSSIESVWASDRSLKVDGEGESESEGGEGVAPIHLRDDAFRALVEENVKANVWRLTRSRVIREVRSILRAFSILN
jgi:carbonic anhydrase